MKKKISMNSSNENLTLEQAFDKFIKIKKIENLVEESINYYKDCYSHLKKHYGSDKECKSINEDIFLEVVENIKKRNIADTTINTNITGLRAILYFFMDRKYIEPFKIKLIKCEKPIKESYSDIEINKLIEKPNPNKCSFAVFRNWAIVCYLLGTGNRQKTLINLKINDIDLDNMEIKLKTVKNKKPYIIPMSETLRKVLIEYLKYRNGEPDDFLFCSIYGEQLTKETIISAIRRYNHSRGISKTSIHLFRHTFAKNWIINGGDILRLQKILGHSSLDMVKEYVELYGNDLKQNFNNFNVLDKNAQNFEKTKISMKR